MNSTLKRLISQKSFVVSIIIIGIVVALALFSLVYGSYNPYSTSSYSVAAPYSVPTWATVFPQYKGLPPNVAGNFTYSSQIEKYNSTTFEVTVNPGEVKTINFEMNWKYKAPYSSLFSLYVYPNVSSNQAFFINMTWITPSNVSEELISAAPVSQEPFIFVTYMTFITPGKWDPIVFNTIHSTAIPSPFVSSLPPRDQIIAPDILPGLMFPKPGEYHLELTFSNNSTKSEEFLFTLPSFSEKGYVYGLLGTDNNGAPVFPEFAIGARFDLEIALVASILIVFIGAAFGIISGYFGGRTDLTVVGITDFFLLLPGLPLLITLEIILVKAGINIPRVDLIVLLISILSWPATTRVVRSQTLSLRSRTFVEAAKSLGLNNRQIMLKHILPNLIPIIAAQVAYDVPTVILIESGLDFLGLGIISFPTWGNMLGFASTHISTANSFAWWWVLPPGLGIVLLSAAFYYLGNAFINAFTSTKTGE